MSAVKTSTTKAPVVTIMGHVDHGKTSLLDFIRKSRLTQKEAGGITQRIGAYQVEFQGMPITFIDTPGHAAFSKMRAHGAKITDIIVLVVAADDGVKPQTKEAIQLIKKGNIPVVVAINKVDVKGASPDMVKAQLIEEGIYVEGYGGNTPVVEVVAREGKNVDKLLETIQLLAELEELTADPQAPLEAVVIDATLSKTQGPVATLLINSGSLRVGDDLSNVTGADTLVKVKRLKTDTGTVIDQAIPGQAVEVLGFKSVPAAGQVFTKTSTKQLLTEKYQKEQEIDEKPVVVDTEAETSEPVMPEVKESSGIRIILLADNQGSLEAILQNLGEEVEIIAARTGQVTESDIMLADSTQSVIVAFATTITTSARKLARVEKVKISEYQVIYELLEDFEKQVLKFMEPTIDEIETGKAKVKAIFNIKAETVAGCVVTSGTIRLNDRIHLIRDEKIIADSKVVSLKQGKVDVSSVAENSECGIVLKPQLALQESDHIQAYTKA